MEELDAIPWRGYQVADGEKLFEFLSVIREVKTGSTWTFLADYIHHDKYHYAT